jgi:uroporphyrinogen decarboxylase
MFDGSITNFFHGLIERCDHGKDSWGVPWELRDLRSDSFPISHPLDSPEKIDDYPFPSADEPLGLEIASDIAYKTDRKKFVFFGDNGWGIFERAWLLLGMPRFFIWAFKYPKDLKKLIERIADVKLTLTERLINEVGIDIIGYGDDWGMEDRTLLSPKLWREFIKPWQAKLYNAAKKHGVLVYQHSDGRIEDLIPDLIEIGVDILNIQRECNNWARILGKYGEHTTMWGGVSARTLDIGGPQGISREVKDCCLWGRFGGLILAPGHSLKYPENKIAIMRKVWIDNGSYKALCPG